MIEETDRLEDSFWTEDELHQMALDSIEIDKYSAKPTHIVFYHLFKDGENTGLVMIACVESIIDGQNAIAKLWAEVGLTAIVGEYNDESPLNQTKAEAMYLLLNKYKYKGKLKLPGSQKVFKYSSWMGKLI